MSKTKCGLCGCYPGPFYVWSSSRNFPRNKLVKQHKKDRQYIKTLNEGIMVCYKCFNELKNNNE